MTNNPFFSIIIPAHNSAEFIRGALESIRGQTFTDYELIVVCDSCTDNTEAVAKEYADKLYTVTFGNDGLTRNTGIDHSEGQYILFMDDDDHWIHEYVLQMIFDKLSEYDPDSVDILAFGFIFKTIGYVAPIRKNHSLWANVWHKVWRRAFIGDTRFKPIPMESDMQFCRDMVRKIPNIFTFDHALYYYNYMRKGSQTELASREEDAVDS